MSVGAKTPTNLDTKTHQMSDPSKQNPNDKFAFEKMLGSPNASAQNGPPLQKKKALFRRQRPLLSQSEKDHSKTQNTLSPEREERARFNARQY
jgi:hypothetical protein